MSTTYGFKSRLAHQYKNINQKWLMFFSLCNIVEVKSIHILRGWADVFGISKTIGGDALIVPYKPDNTQHNRTVPLCLKSLINLKNYSALAEHILQTIQFINPIRFNIIIAKKNASIETKTITDINSLVNTIESAAKAEIMVPIIPANKHFVF